ncbi:MAG: DapH/DapD/GlmU-related protein [Schleiferiaceae bacterium]|nr:DapH/DapD/GlmU-related protein [Schleiferiaceae bacterium]
MCKTRIGENGRIGSNSTILPVIVGTDAIIGAGAVVIKDVKPNSIVGCKLGRVLSKDDKV